MEEDKLLDLLITQRAVMAQQTLIIKEQTEIINSLKKAVEESNHVMTDILKTIVD